MENPDEDIRENEILVFENHIRINFKNAITLKTQLALVDELVALRDSKGISKFIVDTRGCPLRYSLPERYELGSYFAARAGNGITLATIIDEVHLTGLVENVAHNRGATKLAIVLTEEDALNWLEKP
jgi:hypothetical protein